MEIKNVFYIPSGRVFLVDCDGYLIECTEMRDVSVGGKENYEVRNMKYYFKGLVGTDDDYLISTNTIKEPQNISFDQMIRIMKILEEGDECE